jgi:hypothetical protein
MQPSCSAKVLKAAPLESANEDAGGAYYTRKLVCPEARPWISPQIHAHLALTFVTPTWRRGREAAFARRIRPPHPAAASSRIRRARDCRSALERPAEFSCRSLRSKHTALFGFGCAEVSTFHCSLTRPTGHHTPTGTREAGVTRRAPQSPSAAAAPIGAEARSPPLGEDIRRSGADARPGGRSEPFPVRVLARVPVRAIASASGRGGGYSESGCGASQGSPPASCGDP